MNGMHLHVAVDDLDRSIGFYSDGAPTCPYAQSDKSWISDPSGVRWETFHTFGEATVYGEDRDPAARAADAACCPTSACCA